MVTANREHGYTEYFGTYPWRMLNVNSRKYWGYFSTAPEAVIVCHRKLLGPLREAGEADLRCEWAGLLRWTSMNGETAMKGWTAINGTRYPHPCAGACVWGDACQVPLEARPSALEDEVALGHDQPESGILGTRVANQ